MYFKDFHGKKLPALGLGALRFPMEKDNPERIDRVAAEAIIDAAMQGGVNYFDTAYIYQKNDSERVLGEVLAKYPRERYFLATKYYASKKHPLRETFFAQLERCKTEYFDFYLLHGVDDDNANRYMDPENAYIDFLLEQKKAGRIRHIGFSTHASTNTLHRFLDWYDGFDMAVMQLNYLDWDLLDAKGQYELLTQRGIPVWVMEPLKGGRLAGLNDEAAGLLKQYAPNRSVASWGFRFLMGLENVQMCMSGMSDLAQMRDNLQTFENCDPLNDEEKALLRKAANAFLREMGEPCSACRYCCDDCPVGMDIPLVIRAYNENNISGGYWKVDGFEGLNVGPADCLSCGACMSHCPQKINIPEVMRKFAEILEKKKHGA